MVDNSTSIIKICGLRDAETLNVAAGAGATAVGFILAESRRKVSPDQVGAILETGSREGVKAVGVVVNEAAVTIEEWRETGRLDVMQLSGDEDPPILDNLSGTVWKALRFEPGTALDDAARAIEPWFDHPKPVEAVLVDAFVQGMYGGSGHAADWELTGLLAERYPIVLAGGLSPDNVSEAISRRKPLGVDVSSGVESQGVKDAAKIRAFVAAASSILQR